MEYNLVVQLADAKALTMVMMMAVKMDMQMAGLTAVVTAV